MTTSINSVTDPNHAVLAANATTSVSNVEYVTGTDNSTALEALQTYLETHDGSRLVFAKGSGCYDYTVNTWLQNIKNIEIDANGACFRNLAFSALDVNMYGLHLGGTGFVPVTSTPLYAINTQAVASQSVTTTIASNAANFSAGDQVLIAGYSQQQNSWPPNLRYFEINTVSSANASTGQINLVNLTQNYYDSQWYPDTESGVSVGPAAIYNLSTNAVVAQSVTLNDAVIKDNPNFSSESPFSPQLGYGSVIVESFMHFDLVHSTIGYLAIGSGNHAVVENSTIGTLEPDKLLNTLLLKSSTVNALTQATGVNVLTVQGSTILSNSPVSPRQLYVSGNTLHTTPSAPTFFTVGSGGVLWSPIYNAVFTGNSLVPISGTMNENSVGIYAGSPYTMAAAGNATSSTFTIPWDWNVETQLDSGAVLTTSGGKTCTTAMPPEYASPNLLITVRNCSSSPANGDQFTFNNLRNAVCVNNSFSSAPVGITCSVTADRVPSGESVVSDYDALRNKDALPFFNANGALTDAVNSSDRPLSPQGLRVRNGALISNENAGGAFVFNSDGTVSFVQSNGQPIRQWGKVFTYATLPSGCSSLFEGASYPISDSTTNTPGAIVSAGGGTFHVEIYCNGSGWVVL